MKRLLSLLLVLVTVLGMVSMTALAANPFTDVPTNQWYAKAVAWAAANGVVTGYTDGTFKPNNPVKRQEIAAIFRHMGEIRSCETLHPGAGVGYKFNAEGNQVSYRCDLKKVTTINFDRNKVRAFTSALNKKSDEISAELDKRMVNTQVYYEAPFDVNDTFCEVLQWHIQTNN